MGGTLGAIFGILLAALVTAVTERTVKSTQRCNGRTDFVLSSALLCEEFGASGQNLPSARRGICLVLMGTCVSTTGGHLASIPPDPDGLIQMDGPIMKWFVAFGWILSLI
ncbi:hypothetical protein V1524DRAFT_411380 [Lipomyces starkeyi]